MQWSSQIESVLCVLRALKCPCTTTEGTAAACTACQQQMVATCHWKPVGGEAAYNPTSNSKNHYFKHCVVLFCGGNILYHINKKHIHTQRRVVAIDSLFVCDCRGDVLVYNTQLNQREGEIGGGSQRSGRRPFNMIASKTTEMVGKLMHSPANERNSSLERSCTSISPKPKMRNTSTGAICLHFLKLYSSVFCATEGKCFDQGVLAGF